MSQKICSLESRRAWLSDPTNERSMVRYLVDIERIDANPEILELFEIERQVFENFKIRPLLLRVIDGLGVGRDHCYKEKDIKNLIYEVGHKARDPKADLLLVVFGVRAGIDIPYLFTRLYRNCIIDKDVDDFFRNVFFGFGIPAYDERLGAIFNRQMDAVLSMVSFEKYYPLIPIFCNMLDSHDVTARTDHQKMILKFLKRVPGNVAAPYSAPTLVRGLTRSLRSGTNIFLDYGDLLMSFGLHAAFVTKPIVDLLCQPQNKIHKEMLLSILESFESTVEASLLILAFAKKHMENDDIVIDCLRTFYRFGSDRIHEDAVDFVMKNRIFYEFRAS